MLKYITSPFLIPCDIVTNIHKSLAALQAICITSNLHIQAFPINMFTFLEWVVRSDPGVTPFRNKPEWVVTPAARAAVGPDGRRAHDKPSCWGKRTWLMESCVSAGLWLCGEMGERNAGRTAIYQGERQRRASHQRRLSTAAAVSGGINAESSLLRGELLISDTTTAPGYLSFLCLLLTIATAGDIVFMNCPFKTWENCLRAGGGDNQILIGFNSMVWMFWVFIPWNAKAFPQWHLLFN